MKFTLPTEITSYFSNHASHVVKNLLITAEGVFSAKSTNLNLVKDELGNILENQETTQANSNYKRLLRFFNLPDKEKWELVKSLLNICFLLLGQKFSKPKYLTLDGTSWELGSKKIHLLTLAVVINDVSIPICWEELDKKGISNFEERKELFEKALKWYDLEGMILLADREYIGERWFKYLTNKGIDFVIRLKKHLYKSYVDEQRGENSRTYKHQKCRYIALEREALKKYYRHVGVSKQIEILGEKYSFVVFKNPKKGAKEPLIYFISSLKNKKKIVKAYPIRWSIECCFKHLKSNGFDLEAINLKNEEKIKLMMAIVTFLYVLCLQQGLLKYTKMKKSDYKQFANGQVTLAVSIFKKGKEIVSAKFRHLWSFVEYLKHIITGKKLPKWVHVQ